MKTIKFVPEAAQGENKSFDGFIELSTPSYDQRCEYSEAVVDMFGGEQESQKTSDKIRVMRKLVAFSKEHYLVVSLKNLSTGEEYKSFDDLSYDGQAVPILQEVAAFIVYGSGLKNP